MVLYDYYYYYKVIFIVHREKDSLSSLGPFIFKNEINKLKTLNHTSLVKYHYFISGCMDSVRVMKYVFSLQV